MSGQNDDGHAIVMPVALAIALGLIDPPSVEDIAEKLGADTEDVARVWAVTSERRCCTPQSRDGILVVAPTSARIEKYRNNGAEEGFIPLEIITYDAHHHGKLRSSVIDVESVKRLVNMLGEAIAFVERQEGR